MKAVQKGKKRVLGEHSGLKPVRTGLTHFSDTDVSLVRDNNVFFFSTDTHAHTPFLGWRRVYPPSAILTNAHSMWTPLSRNAILRDREPEFASGCCWERYGNETDERELSEA